MARKKTAKKATPKKTAKKPTRKKAAVKKKAAKKTAPKKATPKKAAPKKAAPKKAAPKKRRKKKVTKAAGEQTLFTLVAVSKKTGISMPTLLRYKKAYQRRIPSVGKGRTQRYPEEAMAVFQEIKQENLKKRGRPKKKAAAAKKRPAKRARKARAAAKPTRRGRKPAAKKQATGLLTLTEVGRRTGISYPTLVRYVKLYPERIPHEGKGRKRRFPPSAVPVFRKIRSESRRGPKKVGRKVTRKAPARRRATVVTDSSLGRRIKALEKAQADIGKQLAAVIKLLKKPVKVTISSD